jgi:VIT1/CCC1 family predicted Fe2+/Mn2+ transporter
MSLTLFKSWLFPETTTRNYTALPSHSPHHDSETGLSHNSTTASTHAPCEKSSSSPNIYSPKRLVHPRTIADATIGLSDGLTVPFALTAGLSTLNDPKLVIYGGLAELIAGSISMGLGGYLAARSEAAGYGAALSEVRRMVEEDPRAAGDVVRETFGSYGFSDEVLEGLVGELVSGPEEGMVGFLMRFQRQLTGDEATAARAVRSGATISAGYFFGGLVPLVPYLVFEEVRAAFVGSVVVMVLTLFAFGWVKTALLAEKDWRVCLRDGVQMVVLGSVAAGAAMGCVKAVGG